MCDALMHSTFVFQRAGGMHTRRTIALIGSDTLAQRLTSALTNGNNRVLLFAQAFNEAEVIANLIKSKNILADVEAVPCSHNASWEADIIISTIALAELKELATQIKDVATQKVFIVCKFYNEKEIGFKMIDELYDILSHTKIIEAFFNINDDRKIKYSISSNDYNAAITADALFKEAGMQPQLMNSVSLLN